MASAFNLYTRAAVRISVITPSFDQAQFLPENLETVGGQTHSDVEHIVVDPGSTDGSREIAAAADVTLIAEPDNGQSDGICKGFARATGDVLTWLNSDDFYPSPSTLEAVAAAFHANPGIDVVYGNVDFVDEEGAFLRKGFVNSETDSLAASLEYQVGIVQPGVFLHRRVFDAVGGPSDHYEYCMDYEYWVRISLSGFRWLHLDTTLAHHRWWLGMKTSKGRNESLLEHFRVCAKHFGYIHWKWLDRYATYLATDADGVVTHKEAEDEQERERWLSHVIERFATQDMLASLEQSSEPARAETLAFLEEYCPYLRRFLFNGDELTIVEETTDQPDAKDRVAWFVFDAKADTGTSFNAYHVPGNFDRFAESEWYGSALANGAGILRRLSERRSDVCVVVGNGPSLNKSNLDLLARADVIVSNFALLSPSLREHATMLTVVNDLVARQGCVDFNAVTIPKVLPFWLANSVNPTPETVFVKATVRPEFNEILSGEYSWRSTVSFFNMQLAFALGYEKVLLIGFDHSYKQPSKVREGDRLDQDEEDLNHFDPRYFKGKTWQAADTDNMEASYKLAKYAYAGAGRTILNCTVGGRLEIFPRASLGEELRGARKNPSVRVSLPYGRGVNEVSPLTEALDDLLSSQRETRDSVLSALGSRSVEASHGLPVKSQDVV